jgi:hypothetical protein
MKVDLTQLEFYKKNVVEFGKKLDSFPTWEEFLEFEFVRQSGEINMITNNLIKHCYDNGFYKAFCWLHRCAENRIAWTFIYQDALSEFEDKNGSRDIWFKKNELGKQMKKMAMKAKVRAAQEQLAKLQNELEGE